MYYILCIYYTQKIAEANLPEPTFQKLENSILKKILASPKYGNVYAPNFKTPYLKNIKILPPLVLKPLQGLSKTPVAVYRVKRNIENITITENITSFSTTVKNTIQEHTTIAPLLDQVTEAITVTQISGSSPQNEEDNTASLNFQPFAITSSDFKNESELENFDVNVDIGELISQKIQDVNKSYHQKQNEAEYNDEENEKQREDDNIDYTDNSKQIIQNDELKENQERDDKETYQTNAQEDYEEKDENKNVKILNNVDQERENKYTHNISAEGRTDEYDNKIHIHKNKDSNHTKNKEILNDDEENDYDIDQNQKNTGFNNNANEEINYKQNFNKKDEENSANNLQKKILVINVPDEPAEEKESSSENSNDKESLTDKEPIIVLDNFEKHIRTLRPKDDIRKETARESDTENEDNIEYAEIPVETQKEVEEKEKYFNDIITQQLKANERLQHELEYPDLDNEYEAYRKKTDDHYLDTKAYDFENVAKPYNIQLKGDFPFEKELQDRNYNDDVDEGSDKMRYKNNYEYLDEEDVSEQKPEKQLKENNAEDEDEEEADALTNSAAEEQEKDEAEDSKNLEAEDQEENNDEQSTEQKYRYLPLHEQESKINNIVKEHEEFATKKPIFSSDKVKNPVQSATKMNPNQPETVKNVLQSILRKRDAISRQQNIDVPETYDTFWSLLYKNSRS